MAAPSASRINARAAKDKAFLKRALKNPGLRSKLDPKYLTSAQAKQRTLNTRLRQPVTPGSTLTEGQLATEANAATTVRYGPQERALTEDVGTAQTRERDTGGFYDQYLAQLAQHASNVQAFQAGAQQALQGTAAGITGLAGAEGAQLQQTANQGAQRIGVAPAGDLSQMASGAAATRQALIGSFQAQQALQGAAQSGAASGMAHQVAPTQKLAAQAQAGQTTQKARDRVTDLKAQEGAYNQQYRGERRSDEFKNVIARQTLGLNAQKVAADAAASTPEAAAAKTAATTEASTASKYGYSVHQWRMLGPKGRAQVIGKKSKTAPGSDVITSGPLASKTKAWVAAHPDEAAKLVQDYNADKGKPKPKPKGKGPDWQAPGQSGAAMTQLTSLKTMAQKARDGRKFVIGQGQRDAADPKAKLDRHRAGQKILGFAPVAGKLKHPILVTAALDAVYDGHLSAPTVRALIQAGLKPTEVARTLGVPTSGQWRGQANAPRGRNRNPRGAMG